MNPNSGRADRNGKATRQAAWEKPSRSERMLNLVSFLLKEREPVAWSTIRQKIEGYDGDGEQKALERRFERDKQALKELGVPLEYCPGPSGGGYLIDKRQTFMPDLDLTPEEVLVLHLAATVHVERIGGHMGPSLQAALQKVLFDTHTDVSEVDQRHDAHLTNYSTAGPDWLAEAIEHFIEAILQRQRVQFTYRSMGASRPREREVEPYAVARHYGYWYLVARCLVRDDVRVFRLDRIQKDFGLHQKNGNARDYEIPARFHVKDYVGRPAWELPAVEGDRHVFAEPVEVKILLLKEVAWLIEQRLSPPAHLEHKEDGSAVLTVPRVRSPEPLIRWMLRYEDKVEFLSPTSIREVVIDSLRRIRSFYTRKGTVSNTGKTSETAGEARS